MGASAESIWKVPVYLPYLQPPLTGESIASAEKKIGFKLPAEFLSLLKKQNGGYIRFGLPEMPHDSISGIGPNYPSLTNFDWDEVQEHVSFPLHGLVPFDGDGHWHICLDYRQNPESPSVRYIDVECDRQSLIAATFAGYLELLQMEDNNEFVIEGIADVESFLSKLSAALATSFDPPDIWAHGYPVYRARLGSKNNPEWLWISPNTVPRGFVRSDDARYNELKDIMPGLADRYPELPGQSFILSATDAVQLKVNDSCDRSGVVLRPLRDYLNLVKN